ncbi:MAG: hypothetical protein AAF713_20605 [Pseudomonadota bacterium]
MPDRHEAAREGVLAVVRTVIATANRNVIDQIGLLGPGEVVASIEDAQPRRVDEQMSPYKQFFEQPILIGVAAAGVTPDESRALLSTALGQIAAALEAEPTLAGVIDTLQVAAPAETQETLTMGGPDAAAKLMPVTLSYTTGRNNMEAIP